MTKAKSTIKREMLLTFMSHLPVVKQPRRITLNLKKLLKQF